LAEELIVAESLAKEERYKTLIPQIEALIHGEPNQVANMANVAAALKETFNFFWVGFYLVDREELVLGPFQGPIACTRIAKGKGVCGSAWRDKKTYLVPNVDEFPGHIACSSDAKSEIVIPGINKAGEVVFVLDVDSAELDNFDKTDQAYLEQIVGLLV
jgi:GAF domain-containing protein